MSEEMKHIPDDGLRREANRFNKNLGRAFLITALLLPVSTIIIVRHKLIGMGMEVPFYAVLDYAFIWVTIFLAAFGSSALIAANVLSSIFHTNRQKLIKWRHIFVGVYASLTIITAIFLYQEYLSEINPGRFKDHFHAHYATWIVGSIIMLILTVAGWIGGALIGWIIWLIRGRPS
jgi:hypothetical protein